MRSRMGAGVVVKQQYSFWKTSPAFRSYRGLQLVHQHVTVSSTSYSLTLFLEVQQYRAIVIPKDGQHDFPSGSLCLEFFVCWRQRVLPLHRLSLTLWFVMVHSGLVSYHNSMEKNIFTSMTVQMVLTNRLPCTLVIIGQLPWDPSATHFPIPEVIMDNTVCRTVTRWILRQFHQ